MWMKTFLWHLPNLKKHKKRFEQLLDKFKNVVVVS